jgi:CBS domain-containing protein
MNARDVMTEAPVCCGPRATLVEAARMMADNDCGAIPVVEHGRAVGILTDRDIVCRGVAEGLDPAASQVSDVMTQPVESVSEQTTFEECCERMERRQIRRLLVVGDNGLCVGIIAQADVARRAPETVAGEVVKEISQPAEVASQKPTQF